MNQYVMQDTTLYTNERLNDYLKNYKNYVSTIVGQSGVASYKYYRFNYSPEGIDRVNLGRVPCAVLTGTNPNTGGIDPTAPSLTATYPQITSWVQSGSNVNGATMNTPEGWFMQLAKEYSAVKSQEIRNYSDPNYMQITPGLSYYATTDLSYIIPAKGYTTSSSPYLPSTAPYYITLFSPLTKSTFVNNSKMVQSGNCDAATMNMKSLDTSVQKENITNYYYNWYPLGVEWFGYFKPPTLGYYTFKITTNSNGYCAMWFGNDALFDYNTSNAKYPSTTMPVKVMINEPIYYPIRIQYFNVGVHLSDGVLSIKDPPKFSLSIVDEKGATHEPVNVFSTIKKSGYPYYPPLLYCSFVSTTPDSFLLGGFQCYVCRNYDIDNRPSPSPTEFFKMIETYKFAMAAGKFDKDRGTLNEVNYGTLPDGIDYTVVYTNGSTYPSTFSIYRIDVDPRMGNTYQIDTRTKNPYPMSQVDASLLIAADSYQEMYNYYTDPKQGHIADPETCKTLCNDNSNCNFYYTYTTAYEDQCYYDTQSSIPSFSQIRPIGTLPGSTVDEGSSRLFLRNYELEPPSCGQYGAVEVQKVVNTSVYNSQFPYANYDLSSKTISDMSLVGICGDASYQHLTNGAYDILFKNNLYDSNGSWWDKGSWTNMGSYTESFTTTPEPTKFTNALSDTKDLANASLQNERVYAKMQEKINSNYNTLANQDIPQYLKTRDIMMNNVNYDYNGNVLLYYKNQPIPNVQQQSINDSKEGYQMQNSLYILGTLTAATLLVLAIIIARE
jgi:hypothetical protein